MKNSMAPHTAMMAPNISCAVTRDLNIRYDGQMMSTGVSAIRVCATPVEVYCTARRLSETPTAGPSIVAQKAKCMPRPSRMAVFSCPTFFFMMSRSKKQSNPVSALIIVPPTG